MDESVPMSSADGISKFHELFSGNAAAPELVKRYCRNIDEIMNILKMILDGGSPQITSDDKLSKVLEELNATINEAIKLVGSWDWKMSKFYFVMQVESLVTKMHDYILEVCQGVDSLMSLAETHCISVCLEKIMQSSQREKIMVAIEEASRDLAKKAMPKPETLTNIQISLSLSTNQELLMEAVALDNIKTRGNREDRAELDGINNISELVNHMLDKHVEEKQLHGIDGGKQLHIPADFCCPLSLELMSDPVIVASGQTYERVFIKKWLDLGYNVCPKTRQTLAHNNLIPNYTVKQLIENWCEINGIMLPDPVKLLSLSFPVSFSLINGGENDRSLSDNSLMTDKSGSPESMISSDDSRHQNSDSADQISKPSSFEDTDDFEANSVKLPLAATDPNKSIHKQTTDGSVALSLKESVNDDFQVSEAEQHLPSNDSEIGTGASTSNSQPEVCEENREGQISSNIIASETTRNGTTDTCSKVEPNGPSRLTGVHSRSRLLWRHQSDKPFRVDSRSDPPGVNTRVPRLIEDLQKDSTELQRAATAELLVLSRQSMDNRIAIATGGAIPFLVNLLRSSDPSIQYSAVTVLLNLSLDDSNKIAIGSADAIEALIFVLQVGSPEAKANSAATLFSLSVIEENKAKIGLSGAIKPLVDLLEDGSAQGKKDAATALYNLSIFHDNKARIVQAGAVKRLVELMDPAAGMVDKAVTVLANLATVQEGRNEIALAGGIPVLVEVVELGSARAKENAAAALLQLCTSSSRFCTMVIQEGAVPPLVALSQSGTARAKEKAHVLLSHFRKQRQVVKVRRP